MLKWIVNEAKTSTDNASNQDGFVFGGNNKSE